MFDGSAVTEIKELQLGKTTIDMKLDPITRKFICCGPVKLAPLLFNNGLKPHTVPMRDIDVDSIKG